MMRQPGEWIHGKYRVERVLGAGGMGVVYATHRRNESRAAVKVLHPKFARDKAIRARFVEEGYLANRVGHPGVVTIVEDDIDEEGNFYIVMEQLDGVDLAQFVGPPRHPVTTAQALNIADQLLDALGHAHQKGIVHCDIKPANIMILRDGRVMLLDFGVAKALCGDGSLALAGDEEDEGAVLGTDRYMSPEQGSASFDAIDARSDLWAVGALLLALLAEDEPAGVPLWDQSYEDRAWSFSRLGPLVPPHVVQIISLSLQPQKSNRWVSAAAMQQAVRAAHLDLYGPLGRESLALLAREKLEAETETKQQSSGSPEDTADRRPSSSSSPASPAIVEPTVRSRPDHSSPSAAENAPPSATENAPPSSTDPALDARHSSSEPFVVPSNVQGLGEPLPRSRALLLALAAALFLVALLVFWRKSTALLAPAGSERRIEPTALPGEQEETSEQGQNEAAPAPAKPAAPELDPEQVRASGGLPLRKERKPSGSGRGWSKSAESAAPPLDSTSSAAERRAPNAAAAPPKTLSTHAAPTENPPSAPPACDGLDGLFDVEQCR